METKTREQIIAEAKEWKKTAPRLTPEDAKRLYEKWRTSDATLRKDTIQAPK